MTNTNVSLVADRLAALAFAVREHSRAAVPGEFCMNDETFSRLAETLRRYPDAPIVQTVARILLGRSEQLDDDERSIDALFRKIGPESRLTLVKALLAEIRSIDAWEWKPRLVEVIRAWDGVVPLGQYGMLKLAISVADAWIAKETRS